MEQQEAFVQRNRYDRFSVTLHWLMAVLLLGQIALGMWMLGLPKDASGLRASWFNVHKSWGMVLGLLIALRLAWALWRPRVAALPQPRPMQLLATGAHRLLYLLMLLMPLSGFVGSVFSGYPIRFFGLRLPAAAGRALGRRQGAGQRRAPMVGLGPGAAHRPACAGLRAPPGDPQGAAASAHALNVTGCSIAEQPRRHTALHI